MRNLPDNAIVTCDAGENRIMMTHFYQTKMAERLSAGRRFGADGVRHPGGAGAKLVHPDRPVVAVCGDGGFAMTMNGLMTAIEQDIPIITVVFNNNALGWVLHGSRPVRRRIQRFRPCRDRPRDGLPRRAGRGPGAGWGRPCRRHLPSRQPTVIDVRTSLKTSFADITSPLAKDASPRRR